MRVYDILYERDKGAGAQEETARAPGRAGGSWRAGRAATGQR